MGIYDKGKKSCIKKEAEFQMNSSVKKATAEFIGTFVLVLFGCGSAATAGGELGYLGIAFAFGLSIVAIA